MGISFISNYHSMSLLLLYIRFQFLAITNKAYTRFQRTYTYIHSYLLGYAQKYNCWATGLFLFLADNAEVPHLFWIQDPSWIHISYYFHSACGLLLHLLNGIFEWIYSYVLNYNKDILFIFFFLWLVLSACCLNYLC